METITIDKAFAYKCAEALVDKHNRIPQDKEHDNVILFSFRSLYADLKRLGMEFMIASAVKPTNPKKLPLF